MCGKNKPMRRGAIGREQEQDAPADATRSLRHNFVIRRRRGYPSNHVALRDPAVATQHLRGARRCVRRLHALACSRGTALRCNLIWSPIFRRSVKSMQEGTLGRHSPPVTKWSIAHVNQVHLQAPTPLLSLRSQSHLEDDVDRFSCTTLAPSPDKARVNTSMQTSPV